MAYVFPSEFMHIYKEIGEIQDEIVSLKKILTDSKQISNNEVVKMKNERDELFLNIYNKEYSISKTGILNELIHSKNNSVIEKKYLLI